jgi:ankyrin repeat protein
MNNPSRSGLKPAFNSIGPFSNEITDFMSSSRKGDKAAVLKFLDKYPQAFDVHDDYASHGKTALIWAAHERQKEIVQLLLEKGADIDSADRHGWTALMFVAMSGPCDMLEFLLEKGASTDRKSITDTTALMYAEANGRPEAAAILEEWPEKLRQRQEEENSRQKAKEEEEIKGFSRGLSEPIRAPRPLKLPRKI